MRLAATSLSLFLLASLASAQVDDLAPRTHTFARVGGRPLQLDLYQAESAEPTPLVLWIHGGAWRGGSRKDIPGSVLDLVRRGRSVASIDYRLTGEVGRWGDEPVHWPAQRDDAKAAVRWLRVHAEELNLDDAAFVAWGASAGGHLAAILSLTNDAPGTTGSVGEHTDASSAVALGVNFFGPTDLFAMDADVTDPPGSAIHHDAPDSPESMVLGVAVHGHSMAAIREHADDPTGAWPALLDLARSASPVHAVAREHAVPLFTAHGRRDRLIAFAQAERLHRRLQELRLATTFRPVDLAGHGFGPDIHREAIRWMDDRLRKSEIGPAATAGDRDHQGDSPSDRR
ncbi:MAG: alpha/beta hydrolase [Planctomycetota bacterium]|nr:alpha/beta hydrolase [Planctomycetota bacterium]